MKIRLTEGQYKRLLVEDDKHFLDGLVEFNNIGNRIDKKVMKLFQFLYERDRIGKDQKFLQYDNPLSDRTFRTLVDRIIELMGYTKSEAILLAYNYNHHYVLFEDLAKKEDYSILLGMELEFYGNFTRPTNIYHSAYISGVSNGVMSVYATDFDNLKDRVNNYKFEITNIGREVDYDCYDLNFEPDWDHTYDSISEIFDSSDGEIEVDI
jgi:hypothetical protein